MTNPTPDPTDAIIAGTDDAIQRAMQRMLAEYAAIDPKESLKGIKSRRLPPRARKHSVFHRSYR